jgi:hypothetical protein
MKQEHKQFYEDVINALQSNSMALFAGAGLSKSAGYVDWKGLLRGIATDLGLDIDRETDLISIAQYNVNKMGGRSVINQKIINEFNEEVELTENHKILTRLPINTYWTTNYDDLIERSLKEAKRIVDVKHSISQLNTTKPRRDAVVYKMHGDSTMPNEAVITKDDYETYFVDKIPFVNALSGDLVSKLFLFIGFSFTDPNLDYILSRVRIQMRTAQRHHWYFIKRIALGDYGVNTEADLIYQKAKQEHFIADLKRFKLQPVYVDTYPEITEILKEIEGVYKKQTVFISGSAEEYGKWTVLEAQGFIHKLSSRLIKEGYRIINGFGWGVGSAVINGALEEIYKRPEKYNDDLLIVKPFPQFATGDKSLSELWNEYRREMLKYAGIAIYIFGNKLNPANTHSREIINAKGVRNEFDISQEYGIIQIPVKNTGYMSEELSNLIEKNNFNTDPTSNLHKLYESLTNQTEPDDIIEGVISILKEINK